MIKSDLTISAFFEHVYCLEKELRPSSAQQVELTLAALNNWHGSELRLSELSDDLANRWIKHQLEKAQLSPKTVKRRRGDFLAVWRYAWNHQLCEPPLRIRNVTVPRRVPDAWPLSALRKMVAAARELKGYYPNGIKRSHFWEMFIRIDYDTALRLGDILSLPAAIARTGRFTVLQGKTLREIHKRLRDSTIEVCRRSLPPEREILLDWPYRREQLWVHWREMILLPAGLPAGRREGPQKMRRTSASHFARLHGREAARRHLGHSFGSVADEHYLAPDIADGEALLPPPFDG